MHHRTLPRRKTGGRERCPRNANRWGRTRRPLGARRRSATPRSSPDSARRVSRSTTLPFPRRRERGAREGGPGAPSVAEGKSPSLRAEPWFWPIWGLARYSKSLFCLAKFENETMALRTNDYALSWRSKVCPSCCSQELKGRPALLAAVVCGLVLCLVCYVVLPVSCLLSSPC